jgi:hypothetical protein
MVTTTTKNKETVVTIIYIVFCQTICALLHQVVSYFGFGYHHQIINIHAEREIGSMLSHPCVFNVKGMYLSRAVRSGYESCLYIKLI